MTDPIRKTVTVPLSPQEAFDLFTGEMDGWWPAGKRPDPGQRVTVEPREGGRITGRGPGGRRETWGRITRWEPGRALGVDWYLGMDEEEEHPTDLLVVFSPVAGGTRLDLTHGGFERLGAAGGTVAMLRGRAWDRALRLPLPACA